MDKSRKYILLILLFIVAGDVKGADSMTSDTKQTNGLIDEASPYLLQHAHNPVDWMPWEQAAFDKAKQEDKPIFLSIGYSTCHWCHVMAHESFENERIADYLNEHFISIKVDREERPDIDAVYMEFVQKLTGSGGWPLSVFLTPEGKPFYGGTYFPPVDSYGRPGFMTLLTSLEDAWQNRRKQLLASADQMTAMLQEKTEQARSLDMDEKMLEKTHGILAQIYDAVDGGFGQAPKFPQPGMLSFLLVYAHRSGSEETLEMVEATLEKMAAGGIYDHLGGGFHRYSVDKQWLVPHFEKMLYDQALITRAYVQAFQITKKPLYREVAQDVFDYVLRDMTAESGGFYSAEDADSEGHEGVFYVWTPNEIDALLSPAEAALVKTYYNVTEKGNFERGTSTLNITVPLAEAAYKSGIEAKRAGGILESAKKTLFDVRSRRLRPHRDEKMIAGWNGLMISSLAYGGMVFDEPRYIAAAQHSAAFVMENLYEQKRLKRYYAKGQAHGLAFLDDYAYLIQGLIDLYQADFDPRWLQISIELAGQMKTLFLDESVGGFYLTGTDAGRLIVRSKPDYDGAVPSGNSVAVAALIRLAELTGERKWYSLAEKTVSFYQDDLINRGASLTEMLIAADWVIGPRSEIVIAGAMNQAETERILSELRGRFLPRTVVLVRDDQKNVELLQEVAGPVQDRTMIDGKVTVYLCEDFVCQKPMTDYSQFHQEIVKLK